VASFFKEVIIENLYAKNKGKPQFDDPAEKHKDQLEKMIKRKRKPNTREGQE
jgi:hypothetical protein